MGKRNREQRCVKAVSGKKGDVDRGQRERGRDFHGLDFYNSRQIKDSYLTTTIIVTEVNARCP